MSSFHAPGHRRIKTLSQRANLELVQIGQGESVQAAIAKYRGHPDVEFAEPDYRLQSFAIPNDPGFVSQWGLHNEGVATGRVKDADIDAPEAWDVLTSASNVVVAVIDSGVRYTHQDLKANMWRNPNEIAGNGRDDDGNGFVDDVHGIDVSSDPITHAPRRTGNPDDDNGHGTHVAGIIGAVGNNGIGVAGVAWKVQLMACKFLDSAGFGDTSEAIFCVDYAIENGANVINASWGGPNRSAAMEAVMNRARARGVAVVTAAGNGRPGSGPYDIDATPLYPASFGFDNIIVVTATTGSDALDPGYANWGANTVHLAAPGSGIYSTFVSRAGGDMSYGWQNGTSMSAAYVSGALALLRARFTNDPPHALIARILESVDLIPALQGKCRTSGRLNLQKALGGAAVADFSMTKAFGVTPLEVSFTSSSIGEFTSLVWEFSDGSTITNQTSLTKIFEDDGAHTVTLRLFHTNGLVAVKTREVTAVSNYTVTSGSDLWVEVDAPDLELARNEVYGPIRLPFRFDFYGRLQSNLFVSANGLIGFATNDLHSAANHDLPSTQTPLGIIAPYWDALNPSEGGSVSYILTGFEPERRAIVTWTEVPRDNLSNPAPLTFQAVLEESTGRIIFNYREVQPENNRGAGRSATVGLKDWTGRVAAKYLFDGAPLLLTNGQSLVFTPKPRPSFTVELVSPTEEFAGPPGGSFEGGARYKLSNTGNVPVRWSAATSEDWLTLSPSTGELPIGRSIEVEAGLGTEVTAMTAGIYQAQIAFKNEASGRPVTAREILFKILGTKPDLSVTGAGSLEFRGSAGGPFPSPPVQYRLRASGDAPVSWSFQSDAPWIGASPSFGFLNPGDELDVQLGLSGAVNDLPPGNYTATLSFQNGSGGAGTFDLVASLTVRKPLQLFAASDGQPDIIRFRLSAEPGENYVIEASLDFQLWAPILTNRVSAEGYLDFSDPDSGSFARRFYRARTEQ